MAEIKMCECGCGKPTQIVKHTNHLKGFIKGEYNRFLPYHHMRNVSKSELQKSKMAEARRQWYIKNPDKALAKAKKESDTKISEGTHRLERNIKWKGGVSFDDYDFEFNDRFKNSIKLRDGGCVVCKLTSVNAKKSKRLLYIHHIDYNKKNTNPMNCITVCGTCHQLTNLEKEGWKSFFKTYMDNNYKGVI